MMSKFNIVFGVVSFIWLMLCVFVFPTSGEAGIAPGLATMLLTAPIGLILGYSFGAIQVEMSGDLFALVFTTLALGFSYVQWRLLISLYTRLRTKHGAVKRTPVSK
ncbi:MAG: hypothetical protein A2X94_13220 [Bdellovibrionales bacterium GWB1_55_8]|nr:MAG: hypothetical protein A2X94_13220 [Bdellovibrionales bacterium GWB1_55_8]